MTLLIPFLLTFQLTRSTYYHSDPRQCAGNHQITADGSFIADVTNPPRWVALSRDQLSRWGGRYNYGDTLEVVSFDPSLSGKWVVRDCMNARFTNRIDFLLGVGDRMGEKWVLIIE